MEKGHERNVVGSESEILQKIQSSTSLVFDRPLPRESKMLMVDIILIMEEDIQISGVGLDRMEELLRVASALTDLFIIHGLISGRFL